MNFPSSSIGLPQSLKYDLPPSFSDSARCYTVNQSPDGITQVVGPALVATSFVANSSVPLGAFNSQVVSFTIPSGHSQSVFLDPYATTLSFTLSYAITTALAATNPVFTLQSSAASFFDTLVLYSNNTPIETINAYGVLQHFLLQNSVPSVSDTVGFQYVWEVTQILQPELTWQLQLVHIDTILLFLY